MALPFYEKSWGRARGLCGALLDCESECNRPAGHLVGDLPHRTNGPYGGLTIEYDDNGRVLYDSRDGER